MLDYFAIFSKGGALLVAIQMAALKGAPVNALIRTYLLEERSGESSFTYTPPTGGAPYTLKWTMHNGLGLVFVAVYQKALKLGYVDELLERAKAQFAPLYKGPGSQPDTYAASFEASFKAMLRQAEATAEAAAKRPAAAAAAAASGAGKDAARKQGAANGVARRGGDGSEEDDSSSDGGAAGGPANGGGARGAVGALSDGDSSSGAEGADSTGAGGGGAPRGFNLEALSKKHGKRGGPGSRSLRKGADAGPGGKSRKDGGGVGSKSKGARKWGGSDDDAGALDFSNSVPAPDGSAGGSDAGEAVDYAERSRVDADDDFSSDEDDFLEQQAAEAAAGGAGNGGGKGGGGGVLASFVRNLGVSVVGTAALQRADIQPALDAMKRKLMERNVAEEIAEKLCESVAAGVVGQKLGSFTRVSTAVSQAFEDALTRILTPKRSTDVLREARAAKAAGRPYVVVFVGVNGVGKSTNLAKVAYWLKQNGMSVMVAACDTFRSGAVEQLKTHCTRLGVDLYQRGYEKDPAKVAAEAVRAAAAAKRDVVLVDTAGRMQDNEPLMRALSNLITVNKPDLVLFVGEALVGNDAVDQLTKFNQRLADLAAGPSPHVIDGIVLTKFDTIDDKVGAALSMVYTSGAPVMFVGCGQTYVDLKRLNVKQVVRSLLK